MTKPLGPYQHEVLGQLRRHGRWHPQQRSWVFGSDAETQRILDTLVERGDVILDEYGIYRLKPVEVVPCPNCSGKGLVLTRQLSSVMTTEIKWKVDKADLSCAICLTVFDLDDAPDKLKPIYEEALKP
jgi:hypothetical protein